MDNIKEIINLLECVNIHLIEERHKILDNVFKYYNPFYRARLRWIDKLIDKIDLIIDSQNVKRTDELMKQIDIIAYKYQGS